jgi:DNA-binding LacI/PurR family transcriptional regulator
LQWSVEFSWSNTVDDRSVGIDDAGGARLAAEHVIALGHCRVAVMAIGRSDQSSTSLVRERLAGYTSALERAGLEAAVVVVTTGYERRFGEAAATELLARPDRPTAILAMSDELAAGVLDAARTLDIDVPTALSVVGFDDTPTASGAVPPLTTVHQDHAAKGRAAVKLLLDPAPGPHHLRLPVDLVVRGSTAHARPV